MVVQVPAEGLDLLEQIDVGEGSFELIDEVGVDGGLKGVTREAVLEVVEDGGGEGVELGMGAVERFRARSRVLHESIPFTW